MKRSLSTLGLLVVVAIVASGCASRTTLGVATGLGADRVEELMSFRCVAEETAVVVRGAFQNTDPRYQRAVQLYEGARTAYNPIVNAIAADIEAGRRPNPQEYWTNLSRALEWRSQLTAHADQEAGAFGFIGTGALIAAVLPFAQRYARQYLERRARDYIAGEIRAALLLPPFAQASQRCT